MTDLYQLLKTSRQALGLKTMEIASFLKIDQALISKYENGKRLPTREQVIQLASLLNIDEHELLVLYTKELLKKYIQADAVSLEAISSLQKEFSQKIKHTIPIGKDLQVRLRMLDKIKASSSIKTKLKDKAIISELTLQFIYNTNALNGNSLSVDEINLVLNRGLTIAGKTMKEHLEVLNHQDAILFLQDSIALKQRPSEKIVLQLQQLLFRGIQGQTKSQNISQETTELFTWYQKSISLLHPVILAAELHYKFMALQSFSGGKSLIARILMNWSLLMDGYSYVFIKEPFYEVYVKHIKQQAPELNKESFTKLVIEICLQNLNDLK